MIFRYTTMRQVLACLALLAAAGAPAPADAPAADACYADCADGLTPTVDRGPAAGETAPPFDAALFDPATGAAAGRTLEALLAGRPLVLAFGSYR